jgi:hypothetical protein
MIIMLFHFSELTPINLLHSSSEYYHNQGGPILRKRYGSNDVFYIDLERIHVDSIRDKMKLDNRFAGFSDVRSILQIIVRLIILALK